MRSVSREHAFQSVAHRTIQGSEPASLARCNCSASCACRANSRQRTCPSSAPPGSKSCERDTPSRERRNGDHVANYEGRGSLCHEWGIKQQERTRRWSPARGVSSSRQRSRSPIRRSPSKETRLRHQFAQVSGTMNNGPRTKEWVRQGRNAERSDVIGRYPDGYQDQRQDNKNYVHGNSGSTRPSYELFDAVNAGMDRCHRNFEAHAGSSDANLGSRSFYADCKFVYMLQHIFS